MWMSLFSLSYFVFGNRIILDKYVIVLTNEFNIVTF